MRAPAFTVGGVVYREQIHTAHAGAVVELAMLSVHRGYADKRAPVFGGLDYMHTSNIFAGRMQWLRRCIAEKSLKWAVSVDSDTIFDASHLYGELALVDGNTALGLAPVRVGGTRDVCNLCLTPEDEKISSSLEVQHGRRIGWGDELKRVLDGDRHIFSGGFGVAVFNLDWYRGVWPLPAPEHVSIDTGEDTEHCRSVRERGGIIKALRVKTEHHAWGEGWVK